MKYNLINKIIVKMQPKTIVFAHCDIPCGIYDPKAAEVAAETVEKMMALIADLGEINSKEAILYAGAPMDSKKWIADSSNGVEKTTRPSSWP